MSDSANLLTNAMIVQTDVMIKMPAILQPSLANRSFLSTDSAPAMSFMAMTIKINTAIKSIPAISGFTMWSNRLLAIVFAERASASI